MDFTEQEHAILTDLKEALIYANGESTQFGYDTTSLKHDGRITVEEYDDQGEVIRTTQIRVRFE